MDETIPSIAIAVYNDSVAKANAAGTQGAANVHSEFKATLRNIGDVRAAIVARFRYALASLETLVDKDYGVEISECNRDMLLIGIKLLQSQRSTSTAKKSCDVFPSRMEQIEVFLQSACCGRHEWVAFVGSLLKVLASSSDTKHMESNVDNIINTRIAAYNTAAFTTVNKTMKMEDQKDISGLAELLEAESTFRDIHTFCYDAELGEVADLDTFAFEIVKQMVSLELFEQCRYVSPNLIVAHALAKHLRQR